MLTAIRALYAYSSWAYERIFETVAELDADLYTAEVAGAASPREILVHAASAQWVWIERWRGTSPRVMWDAADFPNVITLRARWRTVDTDTHAYLATLTEHVLLHDVSYVNFAGETWTYALWQQLFDQVNHATQHRSEVALIVTRLGYSPGDLDFGLFIDEQGASRA